MMGMPVPAPETINAYLAQLRQSLKGAPAGLVSDALADCEDHLRNEMAQNPELTEKQILASVVETYGTPDEIAEEYRDMEKTIGGPFPPAEMPTEQRRFGFFNVVSDPRTYGALFYMLLSLATGIFYFCWITIGLSLSLGLAILIIGIPFFLLFIASVRVLSHVEGRIVEALLGVRMPRRLPSGPAADEGLWTKVKEALSDLRTWSSMFYMLLMLPLGVVYFVLAVVGLALSLGVTGNCIYSLISGESHFQMDSAPYLQHFLHTAPGLIVFALLGVMLFFLVLHIARAVGWVHGKIAESLLVRL